VPAPRPEHRRGGAGTTHPTTPAPPDEPDRTRSVGSIARLVARLAIAAAVLTVGLTAIPLGKPDASELVTTDGARTLRARSATSTTTTTGQAPPTSTERGGAAADDTTDGLLSRAPSVPRAFAATGPAAAPFDLDLAALAPVVREAEQQAAIAGGVWIEPTVEPNSDWVDGGNGVRLPDLLLRIRFCESTNDYQAANGISTARGAYQFLASSWVWYGHADRYGVAEAHLATPAQQDEAALMTYQEVGARPWAESRPCWDDDDIDPRYATATPPAPAPTTTTTSASGSSTSTTAGSQPSTTTTAPSSTTASVPSSTTTSTVASSTSSSTSVS